MPPRVVKKAVRKAPAPAGAGAGAASRSNVAPPPNSTAGDQQAMPKTEPQIGNEPEKESTAMDVVKEDDDTESEKPENVIKTRSLKKIVASKKSQAKAKEKGVEEEPVKGTEEFEKVVEEEKEPVKEDLEMIDEEKVNEGKNGEDMLVEGENEDEEFEEVEEEEEEEEGENEDEEFEEVEEEEEGEEGDEEEEEEETMEGEFEKEGEDNALKGDEGEEETTTIVAVTNAIPTPNPNPSSSKGEERVSDTGSGSEDEAGPDIHIHIHAPSSSSKDTEIFVGRLPKDAVEADLVKAFNGFGEIRSVRVVRHPLTRKSKGFAFLRFCDADASKKALQELKDGTEIKGKKVCVSASEQNNTLFVGNICKTWTKDQVIKALKGLGVQEIEHIDLPEIEKGKTKGFCYIEFSTHSDAKSAFHILSKPNSVLGCSKSARVSFTFVEPSDEEMLKVKTVYLEPVLEYWDGEKLKVICEEYGEIEKIQIHRRGNKNKNHFKDNNNKDYALVEFVLRENALKCVEGFSKAQIDAGDNKKVFAALARPSQQSQFPKYGMRGGFKVKNNNITKEKEVKRNNKNDKEVKNSNNNNNKKGKEVENKEKQVEIVEINHLSRTKTRRIQQKLNKSLTNPKQRVNKALSAQKLIKKGDNNYNINIKKKGGSHVQVTKTVGSAPQYQRAGPTTQSNLNLNKKRQLEYNKGAESSSSKRAFWKKEERKGNKFSKGQRGGPAFNARYSNQSGGSGYAYAPPAYAVRHEPRVRYEPVRYEPIRHHEAVRHEPSYPSLYEPVRREPTRYEPIRHEPSTYDPTRYDLIGRYGASRYEPVRHEPVRHEPVRQELYPYAAGTHTSSADLAPHAGYLGETNCTFNATAQVYELRSGRAQAAPAAQYVYEPKSGTAPAAPYVGYERSTVYATEPAPIPQTTSRPGYVSYPSLYQQPSNPSYPSSGSGNPSSYPNSSGSYPAADYAAPRRTYY